MGPLCRAEENKGHAVAAECLLAGMTAFCMSLPNRGEMVLAARTERLSAYKRLARILSKSNVNEGIWAYVLLIPYLVNLLLFTAGPVIAALVLSFTHYDLLRPQFRLESRTTLVRLVTETSRPLSATRPTTWRRMSQSP